MRPLRHSCAGRGRPSLKGRTSGATGASVTAATGAVFLNVLDNRVAQIENGVNKMSGARTGAKKMDETAAAEYVEAKIQIRLWSEHAKALREKLLEGGPREIRIALCVVKVSRKMASWFSWKRAQSILSKTTYDACCIHRETGVVNFRRGETIPHIRTLGRASLPHAENAVEDFWRDMEADPFGWPEIEGD